RGSLATIGRGKAVGRIWRVNVRGVVAWLVWLFVHLMYLVGFRNRVAVLTQWGWSYLTWQRGARLIAGPVGPALAPGREIIGGAGADRATPGEVEGAGADGADGVDAADAGG